MSFKEKKYLIIGASSGIGFALAQSLIEAGASVFTASRTQPDLQSTHITWDALSPDNQGFTSLPAIIDGIVYCPGTINLKPFNRFTIEDFQKDKSPVIWFKNFSKIHFNADPFGFKINDKKYIIFEEYSQILKRGRIAIAEINNDKLINKKIVLDNKKHLSYPFILLENDDIFVICEAYKSKKLDLYKIDKSNLSLQKIREIFSNQGAIDPTIIKFNEKYWLFYRRRKIKK